MTSRWVLCLALCLVACWQPSPARADEAPWDTPLAAKPAELVRAADKAPLPENTHVQLLHLAEEVQFRDDGAMRRTTHVVMRVLTPAGAQGVRRLTASWSPWYQAKPTLEGRVVHPNGDSFELSQQALSVVPFGQIQPGVYSDRRSLVAPLPPLKVGSIVEHRVVIQDRKPLFPAGVVTQFSLERDASTVSRVVRVRFPVERPVKWQTFETEKKPVEEAKDGVRTLTFLGQVAAQQPSPIDSYAPIGAAPRPRLVLGTGASWQQVARAYSQIVDDKCKQGGGGEVRELAGRVFLGTRSTREKVIAALAAVRSRVRYTGVVFGEASILPQPPATVLTRLFGDCKDQAALLVALLREANVEAHVALVNTQLPIDPPLAGLAFDHAIVHVRNGGRDLWVDPTSPYLPAGEVPEALQGTWALIAAPSTRELTKVPVVTSDANRRETRLEVKWTADGPQVRGELLLTGYFARQCRQAAANSDPRSLDANLGGFFDALGIAGAKNIRALDLDDLQRPVRLEATCVLDENYPAFGGNRQSGRVALSPATVTKAVGAAGILAAMRTSGSLPPQPRRTLPMHFLSQQQVVEYVVHLPPDGAWGQLPEEISRQFGPASFRFSVVQPQQGGPTRFMFRLDTGDGKIGPEQTQQLIEFLGDPKYGQEAAERWVLQFGKRAAVALVEGRAVEGVRLYRELLKASPGNVEHLGELATALSNAGLHSLARKFADEALERHPESSEAHTTMGVLHANGHGGRLLGFGSDARAAAKEFRRAVELDPQNHVAWRALITCLRHDPRHGPLGPGARFREAVEACDQWSKVNEDSVEPLLLKATTLTYQQRHDEAAQVLAKLSLAATGVAKLTALGCKEGVAAVSRELELVNLNDLQKAEHLAWTSDHLLYCRQYDVALAALRRAIELADRSGQTPAIWRRSKAFIEDVKPVEEALHPEGDPRRVVQLLMADVYSQPEDLERLAGIRYRGDSLDRLRDSSNHFTAVQRFDAKRGDQQMASTYWFRDRVVQMRFAVDKAKDGSSRVAARLGGETWIWYLAKQQDGYVVVEPGERHHHLAREAEKRLEKDDLESALKWLSWARDDSRRGESTGLAQWIDPFSSSPLSKSLPLLDASDKPSLQLAVAMLGAPCKDREIVETHVKRLRAALKEERGKLVEIQVRRALVEALWRHWPRECVSVGKQLCGEHPRAVDSFMTVCSAMRRAGMSDELPAFAATGPKSARQHVLACLAWLDGNFEQAAKQWEQAPDLYSLLGERGALARTLTDKGSYDPADDSLRWQTVRFDELQRGRCDVAWHGHLIYGAIQLERGKFNEAAGALQMAIAIRGGDEPLAGDEWYLRGRLAEALGFDGEARRCYAAVPPPERLTAPTFHPIAQKRLAPLNPSAPDP